MTFAASSTMRLSLYSTATKLPISSFISPEALRSNADDTRDARIALRTASHRAYTAKATAYRILAGECLDSRTKARPLLIEDDDLV